MFNKAKLFSQTIVARNHLPHIREISCYFCEFSRILKSYGSSVKSWILETGIPTDPIGSPEHRKNDLDEV